MDGRVEPGHDWREAANRGYVVEQFGHACIYKRTQPQEARR